MPSYPGSHNIVTAQLPNGLRVWVYENFESQTVLIDGHVPGGSINEAQDQAGLANMTATMLRRGTKTKDYDTLNEIAESVGAFFGFDAGRHALGFNTYSLAEDVDVVLDLLGESLQAPAFATEELEKVRQRLLTQLEERRHSTRAMAAITFNQHLYPPGHPYRISLEDEIAAVKRFQSEDLARFFREKVSPEGGVVVVVGAIRAEEAIEKLTRTLGQWRHPQARPSTEIPDAPVLSDKTEARVRVLGKSQSDIVLGWPGISRRHKDYEAMLVCNTILGRFGLGGRLGNHIREELGLAYYAYSTFNANLGPGTWRMVAGVHPTKVSQAIEAMLAEVQRITSEEVEDEELEDVHRYLTGSLPLRLETNAGIAGNLLAMAWYGLGLDYLLQYEHRVRSVGKEDVLRVARTYLHADRYVLAVAGPPVEEE